MVGIDFCRHRTRVPRQPRGESESALEFGQNAGRMTNQPPDRDRLIDDLTEFVQAGYRVGEAEALLASLKVLTDLIVVGGPDRPRGVLAWSKRLESIRSVLRSIAEEEVRSALGEEYAEVTIRLFRLDKKKPMVRSAHVALNPLQDELGEVFGVRRRVFVEKHRDPILEVIADALIQREQAAMAPDDLEEPGDTEEVVADAEAAPEQSAPEEDGDEDEEATDAPSSAEPADTGQPPTDEAPSEPEQEPPGELPPPASLQASRPRRLSGTARALILMVSLIAVAAVALLIIRNQSSESGQPKSEKAQQSQTSRQPTAAAPNKDALTAPAVPPIDFTAEVIRWCYCGDKETLESQIKLKPRFVNHSSRRVDLRTGGSARLGLAIDAKSSLNRSWITPTHPRYRRFGKWLVVPPNAPGDLVSTTMFETHWEPTSLPPFGKYLNPGHYEGDLVFNVPPDLSVGGHRMRLAYRLHNGDLYFPRKGAAGQWRGYRKAGSTF